MRQSRRPRSAAIVAARRMFALHRESERSGVPVEELAGRWRAIRAREAQTGAPHVEGDAHGAQLRTRRELIAGAGALAAGAALWGRPAAALARALAGARPARIAIVGGGLAGLRCAHMLWTGAPRQIFSTVYEANPQRTGGRCWTLRGYFQGGLITEHGGSFLNSNQTAVRGLAALLGLQEEVVDGGDLPHGEEIYFIDGAPYTLAEAQADWAGFGYRAFKAAAAEARSEAGEIRLDRMSVPEWLERSAIGASSRFGKLMQSNAVTENGGEAADQSALDLIELLSHNRRSSLLPLPGDDERYHVVGGNDQLVSGMLAQLPAGAVEHGHALVGARANVDRTITLSFEVAGVTRDVTADFVVFALPFSTLRDVDLSRSGLSSVKQRVIATLGIGSNAKIHLELERKTWPALGFSGATYGEAQRLAAAWDDCVQLGPDASPALYLAYPGGRAGRSGIGGAGHGPAPPADVRWALAEIDHVFPGTGAAYSGRAYEDHWALDPWVKGAYSYYRVGQASTYGKLAAAREGRFLFAGEHTSLANLGFLDGAVETGERAARHLIKRLR